VDGIVVGVDGSAGSSAALVHALADAARRGRPLHVLAAVPPPDCWERGYGFDGPPPSEDARDRMEDRVRRQLEEVLATWPDGPPDVEVDLRVQVGPPGPTLVGAAQGAESLVVGHRGRGAAASALLGSVGLHCVLHASCPVTVVPRAGRGDGQPR
jgi:nucleotide-binding universal stress UspA family protein